MLKVKKTVSMLTAAGLVATLGMGNLAADNHDGTQAAATGGGWLSTSTTTTTTAVTVGGVVLTVMLATGGSSSAELETYMRNNAVALQQDLTVGGGATVQDLATAFNVSEGNLDAFGRLLRDNRAELFPLTNPAELNEERATQFAQTILQAMANDAALVNDLMVVAS